MKNRRIPPCGDFLQFWGRTRTDRQNEWPLRPREHHFSNENAEGLRKEIDPFPMDFSPPRLPRRSGLPPPAAETGQPRHKKYPGTRSRQLNAIVSDDDLRGRRRFQALCVALRHTLLLRHLMRRDPAVRRRIIPDRLDQDQNGMTEIVRPATVGRDDRPAAVASRKFRA